MHAHLYFLCIVRFTVQKHDLFPYVCSPSSGVHGLLKFTEVCYFDSTVQSGGNSYMDLSDSVPQMDAKQQTMMWQQNQYMGDSGIHSGATTQVSWITRLSFQ